MNAGSAMLNIAVSLPEDLGSHPDLELLCRV